MPTLTVNSDGTVDVDIGELLAETVTAKSPDQQTEGHTAEDAPLLIGQRKTGVSTVHDFVFGLTGSGLDQLYLELNDVRMLEIDRDTANAKLFGNVQVVGNTQIGGSLSVVGDITPRLFFSECDIFETYAGSFADATDFTVGTIISVTKTNIAMLGIRHYHSGIDSGTTRLTLWDDDTDAEITHIDVAVTDEGVYLGTFAAPVSLEVKKYRISSHLADGHAVKAHATISADLAPINAVYMAPGVYRVAGCISTATGYDFPDINDTTNAYGNEPVLALDI